MKITAEFNSTEELLGFIGTFGTKAVQLQGENVGSKKEDKKVEKKSSAAKEETKITDNKEETKAVEVDNKKETPTIEAEEVGQDTTPTEVKDAEGVEEPKITKE
ncbi:hypothetical protein GNF82_18955, partial [Clostridium perfringens]